MTTDDGISSSVVTPDVTSSVSNASSENATSHSSFFNTTSQGLDLNNTTIFPESTSSVITAATTFSNKTPPATVVGLFFAIVIFAAVVAIYLYVKNRKQKRKNMELMALRGRGREGGGGEVKETLYSDVVRAVDIEEVAAAAEEKETHYITIDFDCNGRLEEEEEIITLLERSASSTAKGSSDYTENTQL